MYGYERVITITMFHIDNYIYMHHRSDGLCIGKQQSSLHSFTTPRNQLKDKVTVDKLSLIHLEKSTKNPKKTHIFSEENKYISLGVGVPSRNRNHRRIR
jgi:hypothetical protein